jgi:beta-phosphoglucomutase
MSNYKAVIFDMDGVLIDAREWHYEALNLALSPFGFEISLMDHTDRFNGMSTKDKLKILTSEFGLPTKLHEVISDVKQDRTLRIAAAKCFPIVQHQILLSRLKLNGIKVGLVTNSIKLTTEFMIQYAGLEKYIDVLITNEDVKRNKPDPEGYELACKLLNVSTHESLVIEDGEYGIQAATSAGCKVLKVDNPQQVSLELLLSHFPDLLRGAAS